MGKRSLSDYLDTAVTLDEGRKRLHTPLPSTDVPSAEEAQLAIQSLADSASDLIALLKQLKGSKKDRKDKEGQDGSSKNLVPFSRLVELSQELLPSVTVLANQSLSTVVDTAGDILVSPTTWMPLSKEEEEANIKSQSRPKPALTCLSIPPLVYLPRWHASEVPFTWPGIPEILDPTIEEQVFTHQGMVSRIGQQSYERLEWIGDAYLELIASVFIYQTFGKLGPGRSSQMRELLVKNTTLAEFFVRYNLDNRARVPPEIMSASRDVLIKTRGDIFEAYVAGVILSDPHRGLGRVISWLRVLWGGMLESKLRELGREEQKYQKAVVEQAKMIEAAAKDGSCIVPKPHQLDEPPKQTLSRLLVVPRAGNVRYDDLKTKVDKDTGLELYVVGVYLDGWGERNLLLGTGSGLSKKEAGQKAAADALQKEKIIKKYAAKKQAFLAERDAANEV